MAYKIYMEGVLLPVTPSKISTKINGKNKILTLINDGEINLLKSPGLTDISFECMLPRSKYPFAVYPNGFRKAEYYLTILEQLKNSRKPFSLVIIRERPNGEYLSDRDMRVSLEDYQINEDAEKYGLDVGVDIKLKQYKNYQTKEMQLFQETQHDGSVVTMGVMINHRESDKSIVKSYTVQLGDALYTIARAVYGDSERYVDIYNANKDLIDTANRGTGQTKYMIYPGQVLTIPS